MALAGIRAEHPSASPRECFLRLAIRRLGYELAARVYPGIADLADWAWLTAPRIRCAWRRMWRARASATYGCEWFSRG